MGASPVILRAWRAGFPRRVWQRLGILSNAWSEDHCSRKAAAVAYYTAFSLAPILVIVVAVAGLLVETTTLSEAILSRVTSLSAWRQARMRLAAALGRRHMAPAPAPSRWR